MGVYTTSEDTWANVENENSEGDILYAEAYEAMDELARLSNIKPAYKMI